MFKKQRWQIRVIYLCMADMVL